MKTVKPLVAIGSVFVVMLAFQNCSQSVRMNSLGTADAGSSFSKISADSFNSVVLTDPMNAKTMDVDIASGQVRGYDQRGMATGEKFCLSAADRSALQAVLNGAEVCQPQIHSKVDDRCLMIYQYPYAQLKSPSLEIALGEKHHGCDIPADLCGDKGAALKALAVALINRIPSSSCE